MKLVVGISCGPCKMLKDWMKENNIEVEQIVAEENKETVMAAGVRSVPSLILDDGTVIGGIENIKEKLNLV